VQDDNGADSINLSEPQTQQARMFSLYQLSRMFNLQLGRSKVRARLDRNDEDTAVL